VQLAIRAHDLNETARIRERESTVRTDIDAVVFDTPAAADDSGYESYGSESDSGSDCDSLFATSSGLIPEWEEELNALLAEIASATQAEPYVELENPCTICLDDISDNANNSDNPSDSSPKTTLYCGHDFHSACFNTWADAGIDAGVDVVCPNCRYVAIPRLIVPIPDAIVEAFYAIDPVEIRIEFMELCGTRQRRAYRDLGADIATQEYITDIFLRRRAAWLQENAPYGTAIYNAVRWMLGGRPPRNADLAFFIPHWEEAVMEEGLTRQLGLVITDREFLADMVRDYLEIAPELEENLRSRRYLT
jgi:hypothetical protein